MSEPHIGMRFKILDNPFSKFAKMFAGEEGVVIKEGATVIIGQFDDPGIEQINLQNVGSRTLTKDIDIKFI